MCADKAVHSFLDACVSLIIECVRGPYIYIYIAPQSGQVSARSYGHKHDKRMCANKAVHCFLDGCVSMVLAEGKPMSTVCRQFPRASRIPMSSDP